MPIDSLGPRPDVSPATPQDEASPGDAPATTPSPAPSGWSARSLMRSAREALGKTVAVVEQDAQAVARTATSAGQSLEAKLASLAASAEKESLAAVSKARALLVTGGRALGHLEDAAKLLASVPFKPKLNVVPKADPTVGPFQPGLTPPTTGNTIVPFVDGTEYRQALLSHIDAAKGTIWLETFEWQDNAQGQEVVAALERAKARGVQVKLVVDNRDHSNEFAPKTAQAVANEPLMRRLAKVGELRFVDHDGFRVNHRKLAIFDGQEAMVMGQNIGANYMLPREAGWTYHDAGVVLGGPAVRDAAEVFERSWESTGGPKLALPDRLPPRTDGPNTDAKVQLLSHSYGDRNIERELVERLDAAKSEVVLGNGFGMEREVYDAVLRARARGVKVTLLFGEAGPTTTLLAQRRFDGLRAAGVELRQIPGPEHLKAYQFDNTYTLVGSSNLDGSSTWRNDEVMTLITSPTFAAEFRQKVFAKELAASKPIDGPLRPVTTLQDRAITDIFGPLIDG